MGASQDMQRGMLKGVIATGLQDKGEIKEHGLIIREKPAFCGRRVSELRLILYQDCWAAWMDSACSDVMARYPTQMRRRPMNSVTNNTST